MQDFEVVQNIADHPDVGTASVGATISVDPSTPSIIALIESGFLKAVEAIKEELEGDSSSTEETDESSEGDASSSDESESSDVKEPDPAAVEPAAQVEAEKPAPVVTPAAVVVPPPAHPDMNKLASSCPTPPAPFETEHPMLYAFCKAMELNEGSFAPGENPAYPNGTRAYFNKNPGNLRFAHQALAIGEDKDGFAIFATVDDGFTELLNQVKLAIRGGFVYKPQIWSQVDKAWREQNFQDFFNVYAPVKDGNDPVNYCAFVVEHLTKVAPVTPETPMYALTAA